MKNDWGKYIIVFFITVGLFAIAAGLSNFFTDKRLDEIKTIQNKLATDILSSETQFSLLSELSCEQGGEIGSLTSELNELADKITYGENNFKDKDEVIELKRYYSLLEIKDFLLTKKVNEKCGEKFVPLLYFYTTANNCSECVKQGYILTQLRHKYSNLRVYSFDYSLDLSALEALIQIYNIEDTKLPATVLNEETIVGFHSIEELEELIPVLKELKEKQELEEEAKKINEENN